MGWALWSSNTSILWYIRTVILKHSNTKELWYFRVSILHSSWDFLGATLKLHNCTTLGLIAQTQMEWCGREQERARESERERKSERECVRERERGSCRWRWGDDKSPKHSSSVCTMSIQNVTRPAEDEEGERKWKRDKMGERKRRMDPRYDLAWPCRVALFKHGVFQDRNGVSVWGIGCERCQFEYLAWIDPCTQSFDF